MEIENHWAVKNPPQENKKIDIAQSWNPSEYIEHLVHFEEQEKSTSKSHSWEYSQEV